MSTYYTDDNYNNAQKRIAELEEILKQICDDAQDAWNMGHKSLDAHVTWTSIHKAQRILEDA